VPYCSYEEALEWIGESSNTEFKETVSDLLSEQGQCPNLKEALSPAITYVEELFSQVLANAIETELLPEKLEGTNYSTNKTVKGLLEAGAKVNRLVDSRKEFWNFLLEGKTKAELVRYQRVLRDIEFPNKNWQAVQGNKEYFWALSEGCNWLLETFDKYILRKGTT